jgi:hypothetical protein
MPLSRMTVTLYWGPIALAAGAAEAPPYDASVESGPT